MELNRRIPVTGERIVELNRRIPITEERIAEQSRRTTASVTTNLVDNERFIAGTGACNVAGCGCQSFSAAGGGSGTHCIGRNSAGGTCNHSKDEHA